MNYHLKIYTGYDAKELTNLAESFIRSNTDCNSIVELQYSTTINTDDRVLHSILIIIK